MVPSMVQIEIPSWGLIYQPERYMPITHEDLEQFAADFDIDTYEDLEAFVQWIHLLFSEPNVPLITIN